MMRVDLGMGANHATCRWLRRSGQSNYLRHSSATRLEVLVVCGGGALHDCHHTSQVALDASCLAPAHQQHRQAHVCMLGTLLGGL